jgi:hypothetical protein
MDDHVLRRFAVISICNGYTRKQLDAKKLKDIIQKNYPKNNINYPVTGDAGEKNEVGKITK